MINRIRTLRYNGETMLARNQAENNLAEDGVAFECALIYLDLHMPIEAEAILKKLTEIEKRIIEAGILIERKQLDAGLELLQSISAEDYHRFVQKILILKALEAKNAPYNEMINILSELQKGNYNSSEFLFKKISFLLMNHQYEDAKKQLKRAALKYPNHPDLVILRRQMKTRTDKFQPKENESSLNENPLVQLESFIGLEPVKLAIKELVKTIEFNKQRKVMLNLSDDETIGAHFIFSGNPGTGKTTIARIVGSILHHHGLLEKGHVVEVDRSSLVGEFIGQTEVKTSDAIKEALGGVLFVDEAYALYRGGNNQNDFGKEAIDTLLKAMEDQRDQLCIIFAGYNNEMKEFLNANPGLRSRINFHLDFPDYSDDELLEIADMMSKKKNYELQEDSKRVLLELIEIERVDETFGNARVVRNVLDEAIRKKAARLAGTSFSMNDAKYLMPIDFGVNSFKSSEELMSLAFKSLNQLIGLEGLKKQVHDIKDFTSYQLKRKSLNLDVKDIAYHMTFEGNPGTGKTTVARIVAQIFKSLGILKRGHLVEATREDLVASYVGQTAEKTSKLVKKAYGGVLFIDEAYALAGEGANDFGKEAIDTLIKHMEDDRDRVIIILAGYTNEMQQLLDKNPGFESRVSNRLIFNDYNAEELCHIFDLYVSNEGYHMTDDAMEEKNRVIQVMSDERDKNFGNARNIRNLFEKVKLRQGTRFSRENLNDDQITVIEREDFGG